MRKIWSMCIVGVILNAYAPRSMGEPVQAAADAETQQPADPVSVVLSGVQELDVEVTTFRSTDNRRQSWIFGFQRLDKPEAFTLELLENDGFATAFIKSRPGFMNEYRAEQQAALLQHRQWDRAKPVIPHPKFRIKVDANGSMARILEWKDISGAASGP